MPRDTIADLFASFADSDEQFLAYDDGYRSHSHTYRETADAARVFAARLELAGHRKGDSVLFWGENRPEWVAAFWGCVLRGAIVVPVDYRASADLLLRVQAIAKAKLLLVGDEVAAPAVDVPVWRLASVEWRTPVASYGRARLERRHSRNSIHIRRYGRTKRRDHPAPQYSRERGSGRSRDAEIQEVRKPFQPIRFLNLLPLSHMFGQAMATFIPPMLPGVVMFMRGYNPHEIVRQIQSRRISVLVCVPKILDVLREYVLRAVPEAAQAPPPGTHWLKRWWMYRRVHKLLGWKFWAFIVGAAPLPPELEEFWGRLGFVVIQGYGLTETAPIVTLNHPFHTRKGSVGKPIAGVEVKISDDGEILVRGDNVTSGYLNPDAESAKAFEGGWFHTGDIGSIDEGGRLSIRGRKKEMIVTADGLNIFPEDVEAVLNGFPGVRDSAVIGVTDDGRERVHAVLVLLTGRNRADVVRTRQPATRRSSESARLFGLDGRRTAENGGHTQAEAARIAGLGDGEQLLRRRRASGDDVERVIAQYAPGRQVRSATTIEELGLSSLERVELLMALERRFGVTIDEGAYAECRTVGDLKRLVSEPVYWGCCCAAADRCRRFSGLEPVEVGLRDPPRQSAALDTAACAGFYLGPRRRSGESARIWSLRSSSPPIIRVTWTFPR